MGGGWYEKADRIVGRLCKAEWERTNLGPNGRPFRRARPYSVPPAAAELVAAMGRNDGEAAKVIFERMRCIGPVCPDAR